MQEFTSSENKIQATKTCNENMCFEPVMRIQHLRFSSKDVLLHAVNFLSQDNPYLSSQPKSNTEVDIFSESRFTCQ